MYYYLSKGSNATPVVVHEAYIQYFPHLKVVGKLNSPRKTIKASRLRGVVATLDA